MTNRPDRERRPDEGAAILYVAVFMLSSLWLVSLAIDMGKLTATRTQLQAAADAAALAGASAIDPETGVVVQDSARVRATETALRNRAYEQTQTPVVIDPITDIDFPGPDLVRVRVHREESTGNPLITHFARTLGVDQLSVTADATAQAQELDAVCEGLAPFAPVELPNGQPFSNDCDSTYLLKVGAGEGQDGNFQLLDYPPCNEGPCAGVGGGAAAIRCYTVNGYGCCIEIGTEFVFTEPGNKVGPVRQALDDRWEADTDQSSNCYQDYEGNGQRLFIVPIIETFDVNGKKTVRVRGFAAFFLRERPVGGGLSSFARGQFVKYVAPGYAGEGPPADTDIYGVHLVE